MTGGDKWSEKVVRCAIDEARVSFVLFSFLFCFASLLVKFFAHLNVTFTSCLQKAKMTSVQHCTQVSVNQKNEALTNQTIRSSAICYKNASSSFNAPAKKKRFNSSNFPHRCTWVPLRCGCPYGRRVLGNAFRVTSSEPALNWKNLPVRGHFIQDHPPPLPH